MATDEEEKDDEFPAPYARPYGPPAPPLAAPDVMGGATDFPGVLQQASQPPAALPHVAGGYSPPNPIMHHAAPAMLGTPAPYEMPGPPTYQPPAPRSALNRIGGALAAGAAAYKDPAAGLAINKELNEGPTERAQAKFAQEQGAYEKNADIALKEKAETLKEGNIRVVDPKTGDTVDLTPQQWTELQKGEEANKSKETVATGKNATTEEVATGKNKTTEEVATGKNKTEEEIATGKNKTAEQIATERAQSAERIATGRNLASTEAARIRVQSADDPNKLTQVMKTMKQQAQVTLPRIDATLDETEKIANKLGPTEGRWNDFWQGKVGASDPEYAHYKDEVNFISTAVTLAHARGRMSNELFEHFQKMFDAGRQAPENMIQALNVAKEWLTDYANMGETPAAAPGTKTPGGGGPPAAEKGMKVQSRTVNGKTEYRQVPIGK